jgi:hypothetical protein
VPPLLVKVPLPAFELLENVVWPPNTRAIAEPLLVKLPLAAFVLL